MKNKRFMECCCSDVAEAVEAMKGGAGRVELCKDLSCGGVTPGRSDIEATLSAVNIPVNVLIRVRGGDFVYDEDEINAMIESVRMCRELGVNGVVVGALRKDGSIDTEAVRRLMAEAARACASPSTGRSTSALSRSGRWRTSSHSAATGFSRRDMPSKCQRWGAAPLRN